MAQVISVVQEKGGAGKTTLLMAIASLMVNDGAKVALIDTDPQKNLNGWASKGNIDLDWHFEGDDEKLIPTVKALKASDANYDVIFIDTAGFKSAMSIYAINAANLVLIPSKANEADAKGAAKTYAHVQSVAESMEKDILAFVVLMDIDLLTNITEAVVVEFDRKRIPRLDAVCAHRTGFKEMSSTGFGPTGSAQKSARELLADLQRKKLLQFYGKNDG